MGGAGSRTVVGVEWDGGLQGKAYVDIDTGQLEGLWSAYSKK